MTEPRRRARRRLLLVAGPAAAAVTVALAPAPASGAAAATPLPKVPTAVGYGGAVSTVDADATAAGIAVLKAGGNAVDAAVAAAATLGVTEPFSSGIGGGGFFAYYDARTRKVTTIDGREKAPAGMRVDSFVDPATGKGYPFEQARISGVSVGVPGSLLTWQQALSHWGTLSLKQALRPAETVADRGFVVDKTFHDQVATDPNNPAAFATFSSTKALYLPNGQAPAVGSVFRNPDLASTYRLIGNQGTGVFYGGELGAEVAHTADHPPLASAPSAWPYPVMPGAMTVADLAAYTAPLQRPTHVTFHGLDVYGVAPPSSGGSTVGEALNILERTGVPATDRVQALHRYLEASALAFADRNRYVGDPGYVDVPLHQLLSRGFADERACQVDPTKAAPRPVAPGVPDGSYTRCPRPASLSRSPQHEGLSTTNLTVADRWGNVVEYTLTIEQTGGNAMVVPHRGFLLNNEFTDFNFTPTQGAAPDPNLPAAGKRPRSSISPTIVLRDGRPVLAVGSPGGATIITTVLQILVDRLTQGMTLPQAIADPRVSDGNGAAAAAEPAFLASPPAAALTALGHTFSSTPEIGAATGIEFLGHGRLLAAAEPVRRGGGSAAVVSPSRHP